ncbi:glycoside hydrolase [Lipomyces japonicus]|uniref:glycoside hydrolase n=1 Tax=Lipomyces japonicus TaxID=56871 RepID=UPI0034CF31AD
MRIKSACGAILVIVIGLLPSVAALTIDPNDDATVKHASWVMAHGMMTYYNGNVSGGTPGMFVDGYYWWQSGAAWGSLLDYWFYTGDETYNDQLLNAVLFQVGDNWDFMPKNVTTSEGNDDQAFWGFTAMAAAERNFTNPPSDQPQWLALGQAVFNSMSARWDLTTCDGGLRWQIFQFNNGYEYKNTISNAGLFLMAARLARYTKNETYLEWAEKTWDWTVDVGFMDSQYYFFYDGADSTSNCTDLNKIQWTYNAACFLAGAAYMYNYTESEVWRNRTQSILDGLYVFFDDKTGIMYEVACEINKKCDTDQKSFKAYLSRFMGLTAQLAPWTYDTVRQHLVQTSVGVASSCTGGSDGVTCGVTWLTGTWDGNWGLGEQMAALETTQNLLIGKVPAPYTATTGGSSKGNASAGTGSRSSGSTYSPSVLTTGSKAGAGIVTSLVLLMMLGASWWMVI